MWHYLSNFFILVLILYVLVYIFACFLQEEDLLRTFNKQVEEDRRIVISRSNLIELHKVGSHCQSSFQSQQCLSFNCCMEWTI